MPTVQQMQIEGISLTDSMSSSSNPQTNLLNDQISLESRSLLDPIIYAVDYLLLLVIFFWTGPPLREFRCIQFVYEPIKL